MSKYSDFDQLVLDEIRSGRQTFAEMQTRQVMRLAEDLAVPDRWNNKAPDRVLDRRLQALRKAGKIAHIAGRWHLILPGDPTA